MLAFHGALFLLACAANPPGVDVVDPSGGATGVTVRVVGNDFQEGATATLGGQTAAATVKGLTLIEVVVPELDPGEHELIVTNPDGQTASVPRAFAVAAPPKDLAICAGTYTAYSQLAAGRKLIKIDRHYKDQEQPESLAIAFGDLAAVEYEGRVQGDAYCSAIVLKLQDGTREVYEDSKELDLRSKAQELAQLVGVPIDVIHQDDRPEVE